MTNNIQLLTCPIDTLPFLPLLWASAKTYYEIHGSNVQDFKWILPTAEFIESMEDRKKEISKNPPDIFGISLYVWNYSTSLELCHWVKEQWPHCIIILGGPHQYIDHQADFFVKFPFVDACIPDTAYGEISIADMLDNFKDGVVDWSKVEQSMYPSRDRKLVFRSKKSTSKQDFQWDFSAYEAQAESMKEYVRALYEIYPEKQISVKMETTRGCPYGCTYCDWGGGVGSKMIKKTLEAIGKDLDIVPVFNSLLIYLCDSNTGLLGNRDVDIIKMIIEKTDDMPIKPVLHIPGWGKTTKHYKFIKEIITLTAESKLLDVYKICNQTFDLESLANVQRTDISGEEYFALADHAKSLNLFVITELIMGFPGMTVNKFYDEFSKPYEQNIGIRMYEWQLLPQSEAYSAEYRKKFKVGTSINNNRDITSKFNIGNEVVVETLSYTRQDYAKMMEIYSLYSFFAVGEVYKNTIKELMIRNYWKLGDLLRVFHKECYPLLEAAGGENMRKFDDCKAEYITTRLNMSTRINTLYAFLPLQDFWYEFDKQHPILVDWLKTQNADTTIMAEDEKILRTSFFEGEDPLLKLIHKFQNPVSIRINKPGKKGPPEPLKPFPYRAPE